MILDWFLINASGVALRSDPNRAIAVSFARMAMSTVSQNKGKHICDQGNFFISFEPASAWLSAQSQVAYVLSVDEAFQVGYMLAKKLIRIEMKTMQ